jgi:hypothetical protein
MNEPVAPQLRRYRQPAVVAYAWQGVEAVREVQLLESADGELCKFADVDFLLSALRAERDQAYELRNQFAAENKRLFADKLALRAERDSYKADFEDLLVQKRAIEGELASAREALELIRPHIDLEQARLNGSYCAAKIDEHTFCGRGRHWPGHRSDLKEWPEHEFIDGAALIAALAANHAHSENREDGAGGGAT